MLDFRYLLGYIRRDKVHVLSHIQVYPCSVCTLKVCTLKVHGVIPFMLCANKNRLRYIPAWNEVPVVSILRISNNNNLLSDVDFTSRDMLEGWSLQICSEHDVIESCVQPNLRSTYVYTDILCGRKVGSPPDTCLCTLWAHRITNLF